MSKMEKENEKKREQVTVPQELFERILSLVDSKYMRDYLTEECTFNIYNWVELIASVPRPLDLKLELLKEMKSVDMNEVALDYLNMAYDMVEDALDSLYHMDPGRSVILVKDMDSASPDPAVMGVYPFHSYKEFLEDIAEEFVDEESGETLEEQSDYQDYYFILTLHETVNGKYEETYQYTCTPNGKVHFFRKWHHEHKVRHRGEYSDRDYERDELERTFRGTEGMIHWASPYQVGDILYVDMRPYFKPTYCLVCWINTKMAFDCCGIMCLKINYGGTIGVGAFKHGRFLPCLLKDAYDFDRQFFSPLLRAEPYTGELPEEYAFMKPLSERLKADPELSQKIDDLYFDWDNKKISKEQRYAYRPVTVKRPSWHGDPDAAPELDIIWHPDRDEEEWWEDAESVCGVTKEQLLEAAGCKEAENGSEAKKDKGV